MTFSGQVPGPTLRVTQGDVVQMTLSIPADEVTGHGNDMHASQMSAGNFDSVNPGETSQYCYIAESAGVFKYHCSGVHLAGMDQHVLSGMYGIAIVDPANGYKKLMVEKTSGSGELDRMFYDADALEFTLQYNQLYLTADGNYDAGAMFAHQNTATVVNGKRHSHNRIPVKGESQ
jgi:nitrite reductase (NO-forming)